MGITDHYGGLESFSITSRAKLNQYIAELTKFKQSYQTKINLWVGLETSILDGLPFSELNELDYALFEEIETNPRLNYFISQVKSNLTIPVGIAHPQIFFLENSTHILEKEGVFIELNTHYPDRYRGTWAKTVWEKLASTNICISIASDAHDIRRVGDTSDAINFIQENNLSEKVCLPKAHRHV